MLLSTIINSFVDMCSNQAYIAFYVLDVLVLMLLCDGQRFITESYYYKTVSYFVRRYIFEFVCQGHRVKVTVKVTGARS